MREWIQELFLEIGIPMGCLFEKAEHLADGTATCMVHGGKCPVPSVDMLIAGTSCKDFSKASMGRGGKRLRLEDLMELESSSGGSIQTLKGLFGYLKQWAPAMLIMENVDILDEDSSASATKTILTYMMDTLRDLGMESLAVLTDAQLFGLPQMRRRFYISGVRVSGNRFFDFGLRPCADLFKTMSEHLRRCQRTPPCLSEVLIDDEDDCVEMALTQRLRAGVRSTPYNAAAMRKTFKEQGLRFGESNIAANVADSPWLSNLTSVQWSTMIFSHAERPLGMATEPQGAFMRDLSQSMTRVRYSKLVTSQGEAPRHVSCCVMPMQIVWIDKKPPRFLLGRESLVIQGFPIHQLPQCISKFTDGQLQQLAGNAFASSVVLSVVVSLFEAAVWYPDAGASCDADDVADAVGLFDRSLRPVKDESDDDNHHDEKASSRLKRRKT